VTRIRPAVTVRRGRLLTKAGPAELQPIGIAS
jgi:hypothetical protein